ncbi:MAG: oligoendopeptidase F [Clostridia bacterium]|nr:oligoendopeptidase F [Clostridia bacterium]
MKTREQIPEQYRWNLCDLYATNEDWEKDFAKLPEIIERAKTYKGKLNNKKDILKMYNDFQDNTELFEHLFCYAYLAGDLNSKDIESQGKMAKMMAMEAKLGEATAYVDPEMALLSEEQLDELINDPDFADFDEELKIIKESKKHILSEKEEAMLAATHQLTSNFKEIFGRMDNGDMEFGKVIVDGKEVQISHGVYGMLMHNKDQNVRRDAFKAYYEPYLKFINTLSSIYSGSVKSDWFYAKTKKFDSTMEMALFNEQVDKKVYTNLIESVNSNLEPLHEYIELRKKILGLETLNMYDLYVPIVEEADSIMDFEQAFDMVKKGLAPLGEDYQELLQRAKDERWMDVYETPAKRSGAYSLGIRGTHPFVLLNFQGTLNDVSTVAHELGHSMHSYYSNESQCAIKSNYKIFVAEVASTCNEILLHNYLMKTVTDEKVKKNLLSVYLDMLRTTMYRQSMFAEFEYISHSMVEKDIPLTYKSLCDEYYKLNKKYYGNGVEHNPEIAYEWARVPHFYRAFYVYKYATGIISAICIANKILTEGKPAVENYKKFLSLGCSMDPVSELKVAGVDLMSKEPFEIVAKSFKDTLEELKKLA